MNKNVKLFSHTDLDGIGCVILAKYIFANLDYEMCDYGNINDKIKEFLNNNYLKYDTIFITDISVNEEVAEMLDKCGKKIVLLDHHKTAEWLNKYSWAKVKENDFELGRKTSGTLMFYRYLDDNKFSVLKSQIRDFVYMVNDYDTWYWNQIGDIKPKQLNDLYYIYKSENFINKVLTFFISDNDNIFTSTDELLLNIKQEDINSYIEKKNKTLIKYDICGYKAGIVFCENYISETGNQLCKLNLDLDFIALINMDSTVSYRTIKDVDVSQIAKTFGGGGHPKASGSQIDSLINEKLLSLIFNRS